MTYKIQPVRTLRTIREFTPKGNATDVTRLQALLDAMSGVGEVRVRSGTLLLPTPLYVPSRSCLVLNPATTLLSTVVATVSPASSPLQAAVPIADGAQTTIAAVPTVGTRTLSVAAAVAVGKVIVFGDGASNVIQQATVLACVGAGPYTLTLDEQIWYPHHVGWDVVPYQVPTDIQIWANGALLTGTGRNGVEFPKVHRCAIRGLRIDTSGGAFSVIAAAYDLGSRDALFEDLEIDCGDLTSVAMSNECVTRGHNVRVRTKRAAAAAGESIWLSYPWASTLIDCSTHADAAHGVLIDGDGIVDCMVRGGEFYAPAGSGILVQNVDGVSIEGSTFLSSDRGVRVAGATAGKVAIDGCLFQKSGNAAIQVDAGNVTISTCTSADAANFDVWCHGGRTTITGFVSTGAAWGGVVASAAGTSVRVSNSRFQLANGGGTAFLTGFPSAGASMDVVGCTVEGYAGTTAFSASAATDVLNVRDSRVLSSGIGWTGVAGSFSRQSKNDFSGATTPYAGSATTNFGTAVLVAGTKVVANTMVKAGDRFSLTRVTIGANPGVVAEVLASRVAGTSFTLQSSNAADTGTVEWAFDD